MTPMMVTTAPMNRAHFRPIQSGTFANAIPATALPIHTDAVLSASVAVVKVK
jgi:hypothetical protein